MLQEYKRLMLVPLLNKSLLVVLLNSSVSVCLFSYTIKAFFLFFCTNKGRATGFFAWITEIIRRQKKHKPV